MSYDQDHGNWAMYCLTLRFKLTFALLTLDTLEFANESAREFVPLKTCERDAFLLCNGPHFDCQKLRESISSRYYIERVSFHHELVEQF